MAIGVMKYLNEHGKRIPEDIKLMGYDDVIFFFFLAKCGRANLLTIHVKERHHAELKFYKMLLKE